jgi:hypothetical protein
MEALLFGELVMVDGCLRIIEPDSGTSYLVVWPPGYSSMIEGEDILVIDNLGEVVLQVGDMVRISGGETPITSSGEIEDLPSPDVCPGRYWIVGDEIYVSSTQSED